MLVLFMLAESENQLGAHYDEIGNVLHIYDRIYGDDAISQLKHQQILKIIDRYYIASVVVYGYNNEIHIRLPRLHADFRVEAVAQEEYLRRFGKGSVSFV